MLKPNIALTMFPLLIPHVAVNIDSVDTEDGVEACPFYIKRVALDSETKKLIVEITQAETGTESVLEIDPSENQALVCRALELALVTNTPVLVCLDESKTNDVDAFGKPVHNH